MVTTTPAQRRFAEALRALKVLQDGGKSVVKTDELSRLNRESLLTHGFLTQVIRGWYVSSNPSDGDGDTTAWYAAALDFLARYCEDRFGTEWCLSDDFSVRVHVGDTVLPRQIVVHTPLGHNTPLQLLSGHSLLDYRAKDFPAAEHRVQAGSLRIMTLEYALTRISESFYRTYARDAQAALMSLRDSAGLNRVLLAGSQPVVAGRLAGALRAASRPDLGADILATMKSAGHVVVETNPFASPLPSIRVARGESVKVTRMRLMWMSMRQQVIDTFPPAPGAPASTADVEAYMAVVKDLYKRDAYNSLSIEGYRVTDALIEKVASGSWNPDGDDVDAQSRDAMAARGYMLARREVENSLRHILAGSNAGLTVAADHRGWYRALFAPSVDAGILTADQLAGYRDSQVFIKNAMHVPPPMDSVRDMMPALFDLLEEEESAAVRAVLGHFAFVYIHPYMDGNGRLARFLMNAMLASGGYPWTVLEVGRRDEYMNALDEASARENIQPFAVFVASSMQREAELATE